MATKYKKLNDNEFEVIETKQESSVVKLDFIETDITHKDKLILGLESGIIDLQNEKKKLEELRDALLKVK